jgi:hypothetical protein
MGFKRVETLGDIMRFGLHLRATCPACGRTREVQALQLYRRFRPSTALRTIAPLLVCHGQDLEVRGCGHKGAKLDFIIPDPDPDPDPGGGDGGGTRVVQIFPHLFGRDGLHDHTHRRRRQRRA